VTTPIPRKPALSPPRPTTAFLDDAATAFLDDLGEPDDAEAFEASASGR